MPTVLLLAQPIQNKRGPNSNLDGLDQGKHGDDGRSIKSRLKTTEISTEQITGSSSQKLSGTFQFLRQFDPGWLKFKIVIVLTALILKCYMSLW